MSNMRDSSRKGYVRVTSKEGPNKQESTVVLTGVANQPIAVTNSYSGGMSFEVSNSDSDLSGPATVNVEMSVSGKNWEQATDANGDDLTYILAVGATIMEAISGIPLGTNLRLVVVEALTGTLYITTRQ